MHEQALSSIRLLSGGLLILQMWGGGPLHQFLRHDQFGAAPRRAMDFKFVHEGAHQEDSAARGFQKVLFRKRVRHLTQVEALPLIDDVHNELIGAAALRSRTGRR
jgi:hypothetical protein